MSTNYTVIPIVGLPLKDYITVRMGMVPVTKFNPDTGAPYKTEVYTTTYTFDGVDFVYDREFDNGWMGNTEEYPEDRSANPLLEALEKAFPALHVFLPPYYPQNGYIGIAVGKRVDQGQWDVYNHTSREEIDNAFDRVEKAMNLHPSLNLLVSTS